VSGFRVVAALVGVRDFAGLKAQLYRIRRWQMRS
jgi:hypothetical protein